MTAYRLLPYFLSVLIVTACNNDNGPLKNELFSISLNETLTGVLSIDYRGQNLLAPGNADQALFNLRFRDRNEGGRIVQFDATNASTVTSRLNKNQLIIDYSGFEDVELSARVIIGLKQGDRLSSWNIEVNNGTTYLLDHIDFPNLAVKNDLTATGGSGRLFWSAQEGCLVEDMHIRDEGWLRYQPIEYPFIGWGGQYPNSTQMQFMAYYNDGGGLYLATHDDRCHPKAFEFHCITDDVIKLDLRLFTDGATKGIYTLPYSVTVGVFDGDWYDAADIYRQWVDNSNLQLPPKLADNKALPDWFFDSPVVITYPVRGVRDLGDQTPNKLFPYTNALKYIERYAEEFGSRMLALLMHWEGSAPWAPPYVWPPYGGEKRYEEFVNALHEKGNLAGLYASGIGYTLRSNTDTTYTMMDEFESKGLASVMKVAPDGTLATNGVCAGEYAQRIGYDMCPAHSFVKKVVAEQITEIVKSNTDYIQYFDQNLGGGAYHCYGTEHGHSYGAGPWLNNEMAAIYESCNSIVRRAGTKCLIGCEGAAAEPYMQYLMFNDARASINLTVGRPVPAYAYIYHEYVNNFMGNQNGVSYSVDLDRSPMNLLQRITYAFCAGDLTTIIIRDDGEMIWDWGGSWTDPGPDRSQTIQLIRNLNSWRQGIGKEWLIYGRMLKPLPVEGTRIIPIITRQGGREIPFESVFTCNWQLADGRKAQLLVNYLPEKQTVKVDASACKNVHIHLTPGHAAGDAVASGKIEIAIEPLSAVMVSCQ